jgi:cation transport ATPase
MRPGRQRLIGMGDPNSVLWPRTRSPLVRRAQFAIPIAFASSMVLWAVTGLLSKELFQTLGMIEFLLAFLLSSIGSAIIATLQWRHSRVVATHTLLVSLLVTVGLFFLFFFYFYHLYILWPKWLMEDPLIIIIFLLITAIVLEVLQRRAARKLRQAK